MPPVTDAHGTLVHASGSGAGAGWLGTALLATALVLAYLVGVRWRARRQRRPWQPWRTVSWCTGALLLAAGLAPSLAHSATTDLRAHMAQHLLLGMYAPIALVLAAPITLALGALPTGAARRLTGALRDPVLHVLSHPVVAAVLSTGGLYVLYLTPLHGLSQRQPLVAGLVAAHLVVSGVLLAWSVAGPDPAPGRPGVTVRGAVLVVSAAAHAVLAKVLYAGAGANGASPAATRSAETAAQWMYYGGDLAEIVLAVALLSGWYSSAGRRARTGGDVGASRAAQVAVGATAPDRQLGAVVPGTRQT